MPHSVVNKLLIKGEPALVDSFVERNIVNRELDLSIEAPLHGANTAIGIWGTWSVLNGTTALSTMTGRRVIEFVTKKGPPLPWLRIVAKNYPDFEFELGWYAKLMGEYGNFKISYNDYEEALFYRIKQGDMVYIYDEEEIAADFNPINPIEVRAAGRFAEVIGRVGLTYKQTRFYD